MILNQMTNLKMIFHVVVSFYELVKIWNLLHFTAEFWNGQFGEVGDAVVDDAVEDECSCTGDEVGDGVKDDGFMQSGG